MLLFSGKMRGQARAWSCDMSLIVVHFLSTIFKVYSVSIFIEATKYMDSSPMNEQECFKVMKAGLLWFGNCVRLWSEQIWIFQVSVELESI